MTVFLNALFGLMPLMIIMLVAGSLGGLAAYLTSSKPITAPIRFGITGYCLVGTITSLTVPLFLSLLQSKLLDDVATGNGTLSYLIFAGFCVLAGFSAKSFLSTLSDRVMNQLSDKMEEDNQRAQVQIQELRDNLHFARGADASDDKPVSPKLAQIGKSLSDLEKEILSAASQLAVRSIEGLAQDCGLTHHDVETAVAKLIEHGLADRVTPPGIGQKLIRLTENGLALAARIAIGAAL